MASEGRIEIISMFAYVDAALIPLHFDRSTTKVSMKSLSNFKIDVHLWFCLQKYTLLMSTTTISLHMMEPK